MRAFLLPLLATALLAALLAGCSSTSAPAGAGGRAGGGTDEDLGWVDAAAFRPVPAVPYDPSRDVFPARPGDSLSSESLDRVPQSELGGAAAAGGEPDRALVLCRQGRFDQAFALVKQVHRRYPKHPGFWNAVGNCHLLQGNERKARLFYEKARAIDARYAPAINNLGVLHQREGHVKRAYDAFGEAVRKNNFSVAPLFNMAQIDLQHGFVEKAARSLNALHRRDPSDVDVLNALGTVHLLGGDAGRALAFYSKIQGGHRRRSDVGPNMAVALWLAGRADEARSVAGAVSLEGAGPGRTDYARKVRDLVAGGGR